MAQNTCNVKHIILSQNNISNVDWILKCLAIDRKEDVTSILKIKTYQNVSKHITGDIYKVRLSTSYKTLLLKVSNVANVSRGQKEI